MGLTSFVLAIYFKWKRPAYSIRMLQFVCACDLVNLNWISSFLCAGYNGKGAVPGFIHDPGCMLEWAVHWWTRFILLYTQILGIKQHQQGAIGGLYALLASPLPGLASWKHLAHYSYSYAAQTIIKLITDCVLMKCSKTADSKWHFHAW